MYKLLISFRIQDKCCANHSLNKSWASSLSWTIPTWQISFSITVHFFNKGNLWKGELQYPKVNITLTYPLFNSILSIQTANLNIKAKYQAPQTIFLLTGYLVRMFFTYVTQREIVFCWRCQGSHIVYSQEGECTVSDND